jgi:uncharacterized repeat protein (TIGR01451 family)
MNPMKDLLMLLGTIKKWCLLFILIAAYILLISSKAHAQFPFIQRKTWDGPFDIKMIAAPNLDPVFINASQAGSSKLLADSLIRSSIMQRTGDLFEINNRYKGGSPFTKYDVPRSAFLCPNPNTACYSGLLTAAPNSTCALPVIKYNGPDYVTDMFVSMSYADYDNDLTTYSSSMAQLDISACSEIEAAYLYWTGMFQGSNPSITLMDGPLNSYSGSGNVFNTSTTSGNNQIKFKIPGSTTYQTVTATAANTRNSASRYLCVADVTTIVQGTGGGQFWAANLQSYPNEGDGGSTSGWVLVVVFRSPLSPPRLISLWDGLESIDVNTSTAFTLTGLQAPATSNFKSYVGFAALDGENLATQLDGDAPEGLGFQTNAGGALYNINPYATDQPPYKLYNKKGYPALCDGSDNIDGCKKPLYDANWCSVYDGVSSSHISSYNEVTNKNGNEIVRLPSNINTLGFDAHHMKLPDGAVAPGATQATLTVKAGPQGGTTPFMAYVAIERLQPKLIMTKVADKNSTNTGTTITYTLRIKNVGNTASLGNDKVYDTLDVATNYAGPLTSKRYVNGVVTSPAPGVTLISSLNDNLEFNLLNPIQRNDSIDITFTVNVVTYASNPSLFDSPQCKRTITNTAYVKYNTATSGILISKSNSNDCGIGTETRVLLTGLPSPTPTVLGPFNACPYSTDPVIPHVNTALQGAGISSSILDQFDIRTSTNVRVKTTDIFSTNPTMSYFAYRDFASGGNCQQVYEIKYTSCPLPITLITFTGWENNNVNTLSWTTGSEKNNDYFVVEKSTNGVDFVSIGIIQGHGNSSVVQNYLLDDVEPANGINYYRLKQYDFDGAFNYSPIISVSHTMTEIGIFPNPNSGSFTINILDKEQAYKLDITDVLGRTIYSLSGKAQQIEVNDIAKGSYFVRFNFENKIVIKKILVF